MFTGLLILLRKFMTGSTAGVLKNRYARSEFTPYPEANLLNVIASAGGTEIPIREAAAHNSVAGSQGYKRCNCRTGCTTARCTCKIRNVMAAHRVKISSAYIFQPTHSLHKYVYYRSPLMHFAPFACHPWVSSR